MILKHSRVKHIYLSISILLLWVFLWQYPWQQWTNNIRWIGVSIGILLFIIPGSIVTLLLEKKPQKWSGVILYGFVISISIVSILGLLARIFHLSFAFINQGLFTLGAFSIGYLILSRNPFTSVPFPRSKNILWIIVLLIPLIVLIYTASKLTIPPLIHDDDLSYNALLAYYRYADQLDFSDTVTHITRVRFWLAFWPLAEAVLANLSGMHGLLLTGIYISPLLAALSFLSVYHLGVTLNIKRKFIFVGIIAQIASLIRLTGSSQPGNAFFNIFPQDKNVAAFIIAPIIFAQTIDYLNLPSRKKAVILILSVMGLGFIHPTVLGMTVIISSIYAVINTIFSRQWKPSLFLILIFAFCMMPHFSLRFFEEDGRRVYTVESDAETVRDYKINSHRIRVLGDTRFYGIAPDVIDGLPFTLLIIVGFFSLTQVLNSSATRFFVSILIILGFIYIPYTGWLLGLAITPFHLWRIPRLFPYGLSIAFFIEWLINLLTLKIKFFNKRKEFISYAVSLVASLVISAGIFYILPWATGNLSGNKPGFDLWYEQYIEIGDFLRSAENQDVVIVGGPDTITNDIIPSLSANADLISFRNENPGPNTDIWKSLVAEEINNGERLSSLEKYNVKYILLREDVDWMEEIQREYPGKFQKITENKKLSLYEFNP